MKETLISDNQQFNETMEKIRSGGMDNLHILADFDRTLTKAFYDGEMRPNLISVLRKEGYLSEEYVKSAYALHDHYYPIEINPNIPIIEKKKEMTDWWNKHLDLLVKSKLHKSDIEKIIDSGFIEFRPALIEFIRFLNENDIPLVIISANGLGTDSIRMFFEKNMIMSDNIKIISNGFLWDNDGNAVGYDKRVIHTFNKDETVLHDHPEIYEMVKDRKNVILLGDSTGDPAMIEGFDYDNLLKFGFLNEKENEFIGKYKEIYDVVMTGDNDGEFLIGLFKDQ
ncbi:MAG: hypothetical protein PHS92_04205 [Candidatus Gracilibacteria bacterium]|nr:hypothetical protein [Candidatus Gracilibacteria bacterium]